MNATELKSCRQRLSLSQLAMAQALGISRPHYCNMEGGHVPIQPVYTLACAELERRYREEINET